MENEFQVQNHFNNMTNDEKNQIFLHQWNALSDQNKEFYQGMSEINQITKDFEVNQKFYK